MTTLPARFSDRDLTIDVVESPGELRLVWKGRSTDREPARVLRPVFDAVLEKVRGDHLRLVMDFTGVDYMNSSTFTPIVKLLNEAKRTGVSFSLEYSAARKWQELSFSALRAFETPDGLISVRSK